MTAPEVMEKVRAGENVYYATSLSGGTLHPYLEGADTGVFFYSNYIDNDRVISVLNGLGIATKGAMIADGVQDVAENLRPTTSNVKDNKRRPRNYTFDDDVDDLLR